ncbi:MAG: hypothetical protein JO338_07070 [Aquitalea sp.]|nr:hypothetical protein [Aquitalea sp.]
MSTTLFCTASRAAQHPQQDRYRKLGLVLIDLPPALRDAPATPRTAIRIMRQSAMTLEQAACNPAGSTTVHAAQISQTIQQDAPLGVAGK